MYKLFVLILLSACSYQFPRESDDYATASELVIAGTKKLESGDYQEAQAMFLLSNEIIENAPALDGLGCVAFLTANFDRAQKYYISAYNKDNTYYNSLGNLALLYDFLGMKDAAHELYNTAIKGNPKNFRVRNNFAALLYDNSSREIILRRQAKEELLKAKSLKADKAILNNLQWIDKNERKP